MGKRGEQVENVSETHAVATIQVDGESMGYGHGGSPEIDGFASCRLDPDFAEDFSLEDKAAAGTFPGRIFPWKDHVARTRAISPKLKTQHRSTERKQNCKDKPKTSPPALQQSRMVVVSTPTNMFTKILRDGELSGACGSTSPIPDDSQQMWSPPGSTEASVSPGAELVRNHHNVRSASGHQR